MPSEFARLAGRPFDPCENSRMFTGIVSAVGQIFEVKSLGATSAHGRRVAIAVPAGYLDDVAAGDSIAINGACMTVVAFDAAATRFDVDVSAESLARTDGWRPDTQVNLEKALRAHDRLGGHLVSGHVDGIGTVRRFDRVGESIALHVAAPKALARYLAFKGSIAVDGVSLTINSVTDAADACVIAINLIPHTLEHTAFARLHEGARVNLEVDTIARYVERMLGVAAVPTTAPAA